MTQFRGAMGIKEFCQWSGLGRTKVYEEISSGRLAIFKVGRRTLVKAAEADKWLARVSAKPGISSQA